MYKRLKGTINVSFELIDPDKAKEYLQHNTRNARTANKATINSYAMDIANNKWEFTGETVSFRQDGTLHNGQHRLLSIIKSGVAIPVLVVRGIPNETRIADWGKARSISAWGKYEGLCVSTTISGVSKAIIVGFSGNDIPKGTQASFIAENYESLRIAEAIANSGSAHSIGRRVPIALAAYVMRYLSLMDDSVLENFFRILNTGTVSKHETRDPSPALTLSRQIIKNYEGKYCARASQSEQFCITIQALLDYKNNKNRMIAYPIKVSNLEYLKKVNEKTAIMKEAAQ